MDWGSKGAALPRWLWGIVVGAVIAAALGTRLPAPWRMEVVNDELHHLESWRNRYRTGDIYPMFLHRLEISGRLQGHKLELVKTIYYKSEWIQRGLLVLVDPQPPLFPVAAEVIEAVSRSNLTALRLISLLAGLAAIFLMYRLGTALQDRALGVVLAGFQIIGFAAQVYCGIGRPYALGQAALLGFLYVFVLEQQRQTSPPWRLLCAALIAQGAHWAAWPAVGPLVAIDLWRRYRAGSGLLRLLRASWWYVLLSCLLLAELTTQLRNPTVAHQSHVRTLWDILCQLALVSPFGQLASFGHRGILVAGVLTVILIAAGTCCLLRRSDRLAKGAGGMLLAAVCGLAAAALLGSEARLTLVYSMAAIIVAGIGFRWLGGRVRHAVLAAVVVIALFLWLGIAYPADPYDWLFSIEAPPSPIAQRLRRELRSGDVWISYPYFLANQLYRYAPLPEPALPQNAGEFATALANRPTNRSCFVLTQSFHTELLAQTAGAHRIESYRNQIQLWRISPTAEGPPESAAAAPVHQ